MNKKADITTNQLITIILLILGFLVVLGDAQHQHIGLIP